jgi:hypothetical protein
MLRPASTLPSEGVAIYFLTPRAYKKAKKEGGGLNIYIHIETSNQFIKLLCIALQLSKLFTHPRLVVVGI